MKKKCQPCHGKGGYHKAIGKYLLFVPCFQCKGKGHWWTREHRKSKIKQ